MISWLIPKQFCCGLICAGVLKNLNTSNMLHARMVYLFLSLFVAFLCYMCKIFSKDLQSKLSFLMPNCDEGLCFSNHITHAFMMSLAVFHAFVLLITIVNPLFSRPCYQKCWVLKFMLYFVILFLCVWSTNALVLIIQDYYFPAAILFSGIYIVVQSIYFVEFAYEWNDTWFDNYSESGSSYWAILLISVSTISWIIGIILLILAYASNEDFWIILGFFLFITAVTILSSSSLFTNGSLLSCTVTMVAAEYFLVSGLIWSEDSENYWVITADLVISVIVLIYLALIMNDEKQKRNGHDPKTTELKNFQELEENKMYEGEDQPLSEGQNYKYFQAILCCYCLYLGMILTNWEWSSSKIAPVASRLLQSGVLVTFYIWTLLAPILFPDREFSR